MQAAFGIVECSGCEIGINGTRKDGIAELIRQMEGCWRKVHDFSHETYFLGLLTGVLKDTLCQFSLQLGSQMGIVYAKVSGYVSLSIAAVDGDVLIGIAIVVKLADGAIDSDVVLVLFT